MSKKDQIGPDETTKSNPKQYGNRNDGKMFNPSDNFKNNANSKTGNNRQVNDHWLIMVNNVIKNIIGKTIRMQRIKVLQAYCG